MQVDGIGWLEWTLICVLILIASGLLALTVRKSSNSKLDNEKYDSYEFESDETLKTDTHPEKEEVSKLSVNEEILETPEEIVPFTPPQEIVLYRYNIKNSFKSFGKISISPNEALLSKSEAINDINEKLKQKASNLGANVVIEVKYNQKISTLFRKLEGSGTAAYIKNIENMERAPPSGNSFSIFAGIIWIFLGVLGYNDFHQFYIPLGLSMIIWGVFTRYGYINNIFFVASLSIIILYTLQLQSYVLKNGIQLFNFEFYLVMGLFLVLLFSFIHIFRNRENDPNLLWKNEWSL
ncbi:MAG: hypothetical protein ACPK7O_01435 [Methanobacterium sp.]